jgi:hypothetical protein
MSGAPALLYERTISLVAAGTTMARTLTAAPVDHEGGRIATLSLATNPVLATIADRRSRATLNCEIGVHATPEINEKQDTGSAFRVRARNVERR